MPKEFWAEAIATTVYLSNRAPTRSAWNKTPQEAWNGRKSGISHLRVFGSIAYVHVPDERRSKLDDKSEKIVFIRYDMRSKGYKLYNPSNGKTIISNNVEFDEEGAWEFNYQENDFNFFPSFEEEEQATVEQPIEEPTIPIASPMPTKD